MQDTPPPKSGKPKPEKGFYGLQALVFALVAAAISNIYLTQPSCGDPGGIRVSPPRLLHRVRVILGIALANLPFGWLSDRVPVRGSS